MQSFPNSFRLLLLLLIVGTPILVTSSSWRPWVGGGGKHKTKKPVGGTTATPTSKPTPSKRPSKSVVVSSDVPPRVLVPSTLNFVNAAWGAPFTVSVANTAGRAIVIVDIDKIDTKMISSLIAKGQIVSCSFSSGSVEPWRPDVQANPDAWYAGSNNVPVAGGGTGEVWLDLSNQQSALRLLLKTRIDRASAMGCQAISPTRMNCYQSADCRGPSMSFAVARNLQLTYNRWLAMYAHSLGVSISFQGGQDNNNGLSFDLADLYDFALGEECFGVQNCYQFSQFVSLNKAVLNNEYVNTQGNGLCTVSNVAQINTEYCHFGGDSTTSTCNSGGSSSSGWTFCQPKLNQYPPITTTVKGP